MSFTWQELLIGLIVALAFYATELLVFMGASRKKVRFDGSEIDALRHEISELRSELSGVQKEVERIREEKDAPAPYAQAIRMVRQGLGPAEIAAACDISKGEAELIASLHKGKSG